MLHTTVNSKTIMTFSILVIVLVSLFASCSILTNQQAGGRGGAAGEVALPAPDVAKAVMPAL
ncbi:MAG: hypothetical protein WA364_03330 [Candidatus Nitrosopolaris sp.]|jgi:hypothetical protein